MSEKKVASYSDAVEKQKRIRCFMDGIDWQHHLGSDGKGTLLFPTADGTKREKKCLAGGGGCGVVEVEVRLIRWVDEQDLHGEAQRKSVPAQPLQAWCPSRGTSCNATCKECPFK